MVTCVMVMVTCGLTCVMVTCTCDGDMRTYTVLHTLKPKEECDWNDVLTHSSKHTVASVVDLRRKQTS